MFKKAFQYTSPKKNKKCFLQNQNRYRYSSILPLFAHHHATAISPSAWTSPSGAVQKGPKVNKVRRKSLAFLEHQRLDPLFGRTTWIITSVKKNSISTWQVFVYSIFFVSLKLLIITKTIYELCQDYLDEYISLMITETVFPSLFSLVVEPTHLKKYVRQIGFHFPSFRGETSKKIFEVLPPKSPTNRLNNQVMYHKHPLKNVGFGGQKTNISNFLKFSPPY